MIRVAAAGDLHFGLDSAGTLRPQLEHLGEQADVLLLAGDLTKVGLPEEASVLAEELRDAPVPVIAVLGNHDHHSDRPDEVVGVLEGGGIRVLEGEGTVLELDGGTLGVAGVKGFGGGFAGKCATDFGEPEMKAFVRHTKDVSVRLEEVLGSLQADHRVALLHYAPVKETLLGEPPEIYAFLGSYLLAEAVDRAGADLILHGHAHRGAEKGMTPGGIHVRNVAQHVIRAAYAVYCFGEEGVDDGRTQRVLQRA
ncbi:MAG: metallophosphoesterase [Actinomycetota bacterium]